MEEQDVLIACASRALHYWQNYTKENKESEGSGAFAIYEFKGCKVFASLDDNKTGYTIKTWFQEGESKENSE